MSYGLVICSVCNREVHQDGKREIQRGWTHCEDKSPMCQAADAIYPNSTADIKGKWCGRDDGPVRQFANTSRETGQQKVGRNDPCPCISGRKFKKCCGA